MKTFLDFLLKKVYRGDELVCPDSLIQEAFERTVADVLYYSRGASQQEVIGAIEGNGNELPLFLFRPGSLIYSHNPQARALLDAIHWLMKELCACKISITRIRLMWGYQSFMG